MMSCDDNTTWFHLYTQAGADVDIPAFDGNTALHIAASNTMLGVAALLVAVGADSEAENMEMATQTEEEDWEGGELEMDRDREGEAERVVEDLVGYTPKDYACGNDKVSFLWLKFRCSLLLCKCNDTKKQPSSSTPSNLDVHQPVNTHTILNTFVCKLSF